MTGSAPHAACSANAVDELTAAVGVGCLCRVLEAVLRLDAPDHVALEEPVPELRSARGHATCSPDSRARYQLGHTAGKPCEHDTERAGRRTHALLRSKRGVDLPAHGPLLGFHGTDGHPGVSVRQVQVRLTQSADGRMGEVIRHVKHEMHEVRTCPRGRRCAGCSRSTAPSRSSLAFLVGASGLRGSHLTLTVWRGRPAATGAAAPCPSPPHTRSQRCEVPVPHPTLYPIPLAPAGVVASSRNGQSINAKMQRYNSTL